MNEKEAKIAKDARKEMLFEFLKGKGVEPNLAGILTALSLVIKPCYIAAKECVLDMMDLGIVDLQEGEEAYDRYVIATCEMLFSRVGVSGPSPPSSDIVRPGLLSVGNPPLKIN